MPVRPSQAGGDGAGQGAPQQEAAAAGGSGPATASVLDRFRPRAREIVTVARQLLEDEGLDSFSMRKLADRLGVRAPVIYKHFASKSALMAALISVGFEEQGALFEAALSTSDHALTAMAAIYRAYGRDNPNLYRLMYDRDLERPLLLPGSEERAVIPAIRAAGGDPDLARAAWAFAHGMTTLELNNRFPADADLDAAWRRGMASLDPSSGVPGLERSGHGQD